VTTRPEKCTKISAAVVLALPAINVNSIITAALARLFIIACKTSQTPLDGCHAVQGRFLYGRQAAVLPKTEESDECRRTACEAE